jgi:hypothetical protein
MLISAAIRQLNQAQPVAPGVQPHGFGIDGNHSAGQHAGWQVLLVKIYRHVVERPV